MYRLNLSCVFARLHDSWKDSNACDGFVVSKGVSDLCYFSGTGAAPAGCNATTDEAVWQHHATSIPMRSVVPVLVAAPTAAQEPLPPVPPPLPGRNLLTPTTTTTTLSIAHGTGTVATVAIGAKTGVRTTVNGTTACDSGRFLLQDLTGSFGMGAALSLYPIQACECT